MAELTIDPDLIQRAAATAIITLLGEDKDKLIEGLVTDALGSKIDRYGHQGKHTLFEDLLREVLVGHTKDVIRAWLKDHDDEIATYVTTQIEEHKDALLKVSTDDLFKRLGLFG